MIKFGLIGCGRISKNHFRAINEIKDAKIISCCDILPEKAKEAATEYNISSFYRNYKEMMDNEELDAVMICTPSGIHPEIGIEAAGRKLHVVTEKPMAVDLDSADKLIDACDKNGVKLFVVKQNRLNTTMQLLKKAVDKNRFGKIYMITSNVFWQRPQAYYDMADWRGTLDMDGGAVLNQASHYVDALYWLMGKADHVLAEKATLARSIESEDTASAIIRFKNGVIGSINITMLTYPKNFEGSITVIGEKGTVKIGGIAVNTIEKWEFEEYDDEDKIVEESNYQPPNVYGFGHLPYYINVVDTLKGKSTADTDGRDGRGSLEIIRAVYRSSETGKMIELPLTD